MAFTQYTESTDIILNLGKDPEDRPDLDDDGLAHKFDQNSENIVTWLNETHLPEAQEQIDTKENALISFVDDTTSRNVADTDLRKKVRGSHATAPIVYTVPDDDVLIADIGEWIIFRWEGVAQVSLAAATGVTIETPDGLKIAARYKEVVLTKEAAHKWSLGGSSKA